MRIGMVCSPTVGGSGVVAAELGLSLASQGHEVHFISYEKPSRLPDWAENVWFHEVLNEPYPLFHFHPYSLALASTMAEVIASRELEILHVHYAIPHAVSAFLAREMMKDHPVKVVTTLHGTDITLVGRARSYYPLTRLAIERSDGVTAVSHYLKRRTLETFPVVKPVHVIPNGVDLQRFKPGLCERAKRFRARFDPSRKVLTHVSNFRPVKRVADVVRIFENLNRQVPCQLLMVGDGPDLAGARELSVQLGVDKWVHFLGTQEAVEVAYAASDLFLLPSEHESFGLSALEAMACGCPVVASSGSGMEEFITSGVEGELAPAGHVEAMAQQGLRILRSPKPYQEASLKRSKAFSLQTSVEKYLGFYREVLKQ